MHKMANYLDLIYDKAFIDAGNILQREGPKQGTATDYYQHYIPPMEEMMENVDHLPLAPREYMLHRVDPDADKVIRPFKIVRNDEYGGRHLQRKLSTLTSFGVNSCYLIPSSDKLFEDPANAFHYPLAQPFTGLRLRKMKLTPWTDARMMKLYRWGTSRLGMKLIFGDEQFKKAMIKKTEEAESEKKKSKAKGKTNQMSQGRRRDRKKYQARQHEAELKRIRKKQFAQKRASEPEDNPMFQYLGSKKISKQLQAQITGISN